MLRMLNFTTRKGRTFDMKKRVLMLLPGIVLFINSAVCVYGETGNDGQ